jgi:hypothetical protein
MVGFRRYQGKKYRYLSFKFSRYPSIEKTVQFPHPGTVMELAYSLCRHRRKRNGTLKSRTNCHPDVMHSLRLPLNLVIALAGLAVECGACTVVYPDVTTGPNFQVRVTDRGRPVKGLRLKVAGQQVVTDKDGIASFRNTRTGSYVVSADHDDGVSDAVNLEVKSDGPPNIVDRPTLLFP